jgi:glycosyltransferase involved in cell wall biosynthesis
MFQFKTIEFVGHHGISMVSNVEADYQKQEQTVWEVAPEKGMINVSIIITNYNYSKYLNRSIRSAFVQNYPTERYEVIVVDDSSNDWSREIIESYGRLIASIFLDRNVGLSAARNKGIEGARGKYVVFLDADDYVSRDMIFVESMFLDLNPQWAAVGCDYYLIDDNERIIGRHSCLDSPIACGIMFRKEKLVEIGMYDESFRVHEDKELQARFCTKYEIHHIELPLYRYRQHDRNLSSDEQTSKKFLLKLGKHQ